MKKLNYIKGCRTCFNDLKGTESGNIDIPEDLSFGYSNVSHAFHYSTSNSFRSDLFDQFSSYGPYKYQILVGDTDGSTMTIFMEESASVMDLKNEISNKNGISPKHQKLWYHSKEILCNEIISDVFSSYNYPYYHVNLTIPLMGGGKLGDLSLKFKETVEMDVESPKYNNFLYRCVVHRFYMLDNGQIEEESTISLYNLTSFTLNIKNEVKKKMYKNRLPNLLKKKELDSINLKCSLLEMKPRIGNQGNILVRKSSLLNFMEDLEGEEDFNRNLLPHKIKYSRKGRPMVDLYVSSRMDILKNRNMRDKYKYRVNTIVEYLSVEFPKILKDHNCYIPLTLIVVDPILDMKVYITSDNKIFYSTNDYESGSQKNKKNSLYYYHMKLLLKVTDEDYVHLEKNEGWTNIRTVRNNVKKYIEEFASSLSLFFHKGEQTGMVVDVKEMMKRFISKNPEFIASILKNTGEVLEEKKSCFGLNVDEEIDFPLFKERRKFRLVGNKLESTVLIGYSHDGAERLRSRLKFKGERDKRMFELGTFSFIDSSKYYAMNNHLIFFLCFLDLQGDKLKELTGNGMNELLKDLENIEFNFHLDQIYADKITENFENNNGLDVTLRF